ncbi:hypothetical protein LOK49_LG04G03643 [Camellia lanceoleosa]|uniref:Uncharacterized protein n=1 Tax=Camellia lanceoleosa TaxID=1840588 RepID=A0ACC0HTM8_9ERIC|nr:hypothetical protein LOK49_LG04G03643 [Camellia lanceoleosa]
MQGDSRILWIQRVILVSDHGPHLMAVGRKISGDHMLMLRAGIPNGPRLSYLGEGEEEEEEGMIHPDEDCMPKAADENPRTSSP